MALVPGHRRTLLPGYLCSANINRSQTLPLTLALFYWDVSAVLLFYSSTFLSWYFPSNLSAVRLRHIVTLSLSGWMALLMRNFLAHWLIWLADLSWYLGTAMA